MYLALSVCVPSGVFVYPVVSTGVYHNRYACLNWSIIYFTNIYIDINTNYFNIFIIFLVNHSLILIDYNSLLFFLFEFLPLIFILNRSMIDICMIINVYIQWDACLALYDICMIYILIVYTDRMGLVIIWLFKWCVYIYIYWGICHYQVIDSI